MTGGDVIVSLILIFWMGICLLGQWKSAFIDRYRSKDLFRLIPNWHLFAPVPHTKDYHLEYRLRDFGRQCTSWKRVELVAPRKLTSVFWYPEKRLRRELVTSVGRLMKLFANKGNNVAIRSASYLTFLNCVRRVSQKLPADAIQFRIISSQDNVVSTEYRSVYLSNWHKHTGLT